MCCWSACTQRVRSTGTGLAWTARLSRLKKGACHRPEPDGPGQAGHKAPPRHRRARHAARLLPERGQPTRHRHDGGHPRCHSASAEWPTRATATPSGQAARRQGLRCPTPPTGVPGAGDRPAHRAEGYRKQRETRSASLGRRAYPRVVQPLPPPTRPLRATQRHLRGLHEPRDQSHHSQPDQTVLLGALKHPCGGPDTAWAACICVVERGETNSYVNAGQPILLVFA